MKQKTSIITVGLSPAWDITCRGENLDWGRHKNIDEQTIVPAGKALNVSRALAWMGQKNIAAGLWGRNDYRQMQAAVKSLWPAIDVKMTTTAGSTRRNVTVVDTTKNKEMHLRCKSELACPGSLKKLKADLEEIVHKNSICVFSGAIPEGNLLDDVIEIIKNCSEAGGKIVLDTSGLALREIIQTGEVWLIKPNVRELCELMGRQIGDNPASLARAGRELLDKVGIVLISRGKNGAIAVTKKGTWLGKYTDRKKVLSTVGCGDFLLAGFLKGLFLETNNTASALKTAVKVATAKALGRAESEPWPKGLEQIEVEIRRMK
jgi:1-phosphofructokinase